MPRGNVTVVTRAANGNDLSAIQNDTNLENLRAGVLHSTEAPDPDFPFGVLADTAGAAVADAPEDFEVRGVYHQIKTPAALGLPGAVTDGLVLVTTHKLRLNADDGAATQIAFSQVTGSFYTRAGLTASGWGAWVSSDLYARLNRVQSYTRTQAITPVAGVDYAAAITLDASLSDAFIIDPLTGNLTLNNPTGLTDGQTLTVALQQDATGGRTVAYGSLWKFINAAANSQPASGANKRSLISGKYYAAQAAIVCNMLKDY